MRAVATSSRVWRAIISSSLVGITHAATRLAGVLMRGPPRRVGVGIELDAEPRGVAADALAQRRAVLADAGGEHDRVEPAERGRERAELAADPVDEEVDRRLGAAARRSPRSVRMSLEMPDTPSSPDCW